MNVFFFCLSEQLSNSDNQVWQQCNSSFRVRILGKFDWSFGLRKHQCARLPLRAGLYPCWGVSLCTWWESLPPSLHLLLGRPPWWWVLCLQGSGGLPLLSACPLSPWRTWSWRSWGPGDCWLRGTVVGCRAECPRHLGTVTDGSETQTNASQSVWGVPSLRSPHLHAGEPW